MSTLLSSHQNNARLEKVKHSIHGLLSQNLTLPKNSVPDYLTSDYRVGTYKNFGQGRYSYELVRDLLKFRAECRESKAHGLNFWAVFEESDDLSEAEFETCLLKELSYATVHSELTSKCDPNFSSDTNDKCLFFNLEGTVFSVVGLHPHCSQPSRRFAHPTLIFAIDDERCDRTKMNASEANYIEMKNEGSMNEVSTIAGPATAKLQQDFALRNLLGSTPEVASDDAEQFLQKSSAENPIFWSFDLRRVQTNVIPF